MEKHSKNIESTKKTSSYLEPKSIVVVILSAATTLSLFFSLNTDNATNSTVASSTFLLKIIISVVTAALTATTSLYLIRGRENKFRKKMIYIIYQRTDLAIAYDVAKQLKERGFYPWLDEEEITPGQKWSTTTSKALSESALALIIVSRNTRFESSWVAKELKVAMQMLSSKDETVSPIIPIRLDDSPLPEELRDVQGVFYSDPNYIDKLERGLNRVLGTK
jgi:hypothetical protein